MKKQVKKQPSKYTTENVDVEKAGLAYIQGNVTKTDWSRMSPALRKAVLRYAKKVKKGLIKPVEEDNEPSVVLEPIEPEMEHAGEEIVKILEEKKANGEQSN